MFLKAEYSAYFVFLLLLGTALRVAGVRTKKVVRLKMMKSQAGEVLELSQALAIRIILNETSGSPNACQALHHGEKIVVNETSESAMESFEALKGKLVEVDKPFMESVNGLIHQILRKADKADAKKKMPSEGVEASHSAKKRTRRTHQKEEASPQGDSSSGQQIITYRRGLRQRAAHKKVLLDDIAVDESGCAPDLLLIRLLFMLGQEIDTKLGELWPQEVTDEKKTFAGKFARVANFIGEWFQMREEEAIKNKNDKKGVDKKICQIYNKFVREDLKSIVLDIVENTQLQPIPEPRQIPEPQPIPEPQSNPEPKMKRQKHANNKLELSKTFMHSEKGEGLGNWILALPVQAPVPVPVPEKKTGLDTMWKDRRGRTKNGRRGGPAGGRQPAGGEEQNGPGSSTALGSGVEMEMAGSGASESASAVSSIDFNFMAEAGASAPASAAPSIEMGEASAPMATEETGTSGNTLANLTEVQAVQEPRPAGFIAHTPSGTAIDLNDPQEMEDDGTSGALGQQNHIG